MNPSRRTRKANNDTALTAAGTLESHLTRGAFFDILWIIKMETINTHPVIRLYGNGGICIPAPRVRTSKMNPRSISSRAIRKLSL